jgi:hypothetical protein
MMPIPFLSPAAAAVLPSGVPPMVGAPAADFAALLPGFVAPVMPRQDDAEGGKDLPAGPVDDEGDVGEPAIAWVMPPLWPAICPPVDAVRGEVAAPSGGLASGGSARTVVPPPVAPVVLPVAAEAETGALAIADRSPVTGSNIDPAPIFAGAGAGLVPGPRREVQPVRSNPDVAAPAVQAPPMMRTIPTALVPGERGGAVVTGPLGGLRGRTQPGGFLVQAPASARVVAVLLSPAPLTPVVPSAAADSAPVVATLPPKASAPADMTGTTTTQEAPAVAVAAQRLALAPGDTAGTITKQEAPAVTAEAERLAPNAAARPTPQAELQPVQPTRIAPAAEMFAAAIQRAVRDERRPAADELAAGIVAPSADPATRAVAAPEASRHAALDMARETWPAKMIERIEMLRDAADAADTSVRLMPDQLGAIDVSLRRDGDTVQVQFTAQQAETRQLLADAQPKLTELAEARGLRLAMQAGGEGAAGQQSQQQRAAASALPITASRAPSEDDVSAADERIA